MQLRVLGASGSHNGELYSTSILLDERVLVDAGTGAFLLDMQATDKIEDVLLTHSHLDHTAMLCFLADCRIDGKKGHGLRVHCLEETAMAVREGFLNGKIWPDFENIVINGVPLLTFEIFRPFDKLKVGGLQITPLAVVHQVPTVGYCFHGARGDFVFIVDIHKMPNETIDYINGIKNLHAMTIEVSYPEGKEELAEASGHLTPLLLEEMLTKLPSDVTIYYCHLKPRYREEIIAQMKKRFGDKAVLLEQEMIFNF